MRKYPVLIIIFGLSLWACASLADEFTIRGELKGCRQIVELDRALQGPDAQYFAGWSDADFDQAVAWSKTCFSSGFQFAGPYREESLRNYQQRVRAAEKRAADDVELERKRIADADARSQFEKQKKQEQAEKELKLQESQRVLAECQTTKQFKLYDSQESVIDTIDQISGWKEKKAQERRYVNESGVRDLGEERNIGGWIVSLQDSLKEFFSEYKKLGGKASTPSKVTHKLQDPCSSLR